MNKLYIYYLIPVLFVMILQESCKLEKTVYPVEKRVLADSVMVVTAHPLATEAGLEVLRQGGNAGDAAVAVQFALAVTFPRAGNIGGSGFMIYRGADGEVAALDFREKAPAAAYRDMYLDSLGNAIDSLSRHGHFAVGVPGIVDGMVKAHAKYGNIKDFGSLIAPAIRMAEEGVRLTQAEANSYNDFQGEFKAVNTAPTPFIQERPFVRGELFKQPELAATLRRIAQGGEAGFYEGKTADLIVAEMQRGGGIITHQDLKEYEAIWRKPIQEAYKEYLVISMPPPSSGGVALCQLLNIVEQYPLAEYGYHSPEHIHLVAEAERRVYADRATHLGDSDFWPVPCDTMLHEDYLNACMASFDPLNATSSDSVEAGDIALPPKESEETTHFSIVDQWGNAVSITTTINANYGSKVMVGGAGFFLNNEMDDFSAKPGAPNLYGLLGNDANAIAPGKRMLSSMTPTVVLKGDQLYMVVGTPGGSTIITSVFQTFLNVAEFGLPLTEAVHNKRFHAQWRPDSIFIEENALPQSTIEALEAKGHKVVTRSPIGRVEAILRHPDGKLEGVADIRGDDDAGGW
jgi:gamma-glutamyltranspeptidase/glutathione hydrolase